MQHYPQTTAIRDLTADELDIVSGADNEKVGQQVVTSMWNTISDVNGIIAWGKSAPASGSGSGVCHTNHHTA